MLDPQPVSIWHEHGTWDGERASIVFLTQGSPCEVLDRAETEETDRQVTVTLYQGRDPDGDPDEPCDGPAHLVTVVLPAFGSGPPSEARPLVNGADPAAP
ncbi:MAG: hypothetical protein JJT89_11095 [Nitriliruptoraceae bacterium]|nr:hypothetical protein [Nitriliruptoraceae bacterium]